MARLFLSENKFAKTAGKPKVKIVLSDILDEGMDLIPLHSSDMYYNGRTDILKKYQAHIVINDVVAFTCNAALIHTLASMLSREIDNIAYELADNR